MIGRLSTGSGNLLVDACSSARPPVYFRCTLAARSSEAYLGNLFLGSSRPARRARWLVAFPPPLNKRDEWFTSGVSLF